MELKITKGKIEMAGKALDVLDWLVLDFVKVLDGLHLKYVVVSGYVPILFGRSRGSEDVDLILERIDAAKFGKLWAKLSERFDCVNAGSQKSAYETYLATGHSVRFSRKNEFIPNIEVKFPKTMLDRWALHQRKEVLLNGKHSLFISPIELQIPFKLLLGSEKDIEDARYLYDIFKDRMDNRLFTEFLKKLNKEDAFRRFLMKTT